MTLSAALHIGAAGVLVFVTDWIGLGSMMNQTNTDLSAVVLALEDLSTVTPQESSSGPNAAVTEPEREDVKPIPPISRSEPSPVVLGISDSDALTENWLGFAEATEHLAPKSEVSQPALSPNAELAVGTPDGGGEPGGETLPAPSKSANAVDGDTKEGASEPEPEAAPAPASASTPAPVSPAVEPPNALLTPRAEPELVPETSIDPVAVEMSTEEAGGQPEPKRSEPFDEPHAASNAQLQHKDEAATEPAPDAPEPREPTPADADANAVAAEPTRPTDPSQEPTDISADSTPLPLPEPESTMPVTGELAAPGAEGSDAPKGSDAEASPESIQSRKEAPAVSVDGALVYRPGRPLAAEGLEITPVGARFTKFARVTARPRFPVMQIRFNRLGHVSSVKVIRTSGYPTDVDLPIVNALWKWTAAGEQLDRLPKDDPKAGVTIAVQYLLPR